MPDLSSRSAAMKTRGRDSEQAHSREVEIHARYAPLVKEAKRALRWIKKYRGSIVGVHGDDIVETLSDALKGIGEKCS